MEQEIFKTCLKQISEHVSVVSFFHDYFIFGWCSLVQNRLLKVSNILFLTRLHQQSQWCILVWAGSITNCTTTMRLCEILYSYKFQFRCQYKGSCNIDWRYKAKPLCTPNLFYWCSFQNIGYQTIRRAYIQLMFQSLLIKFSRNQGVWACAGVNEKGKYFLEQSAGKPCGRGARYVLLWIHLPR